MSVQLCIDWPQEESTAMGLVNAAPLCAAVCGNGGGERAGDRNSDHSDGAR